MATANFADFLKAHGKPSQLIESDHGHEGHYANHVDGHVVDWTLKQFHPHTPVPFVGPLSEYQKLIPDARLSDRDPVSVYEVDDAHPYFWDDERKQRHSGWENAFRSPNGNPRLGTAHKLWWKKGDWGRGLISPDGTVHTWPEEEMEHNQRAYVLGLAPASCRHFGIQPDGKVYATGDVYDDAHAAETIRQAEAAMGNPNGTTAAVPQMLQHNACPKCGGAWVNTEDDVVCNRCGYSVPYDGWEALQGHKNPYQWALDTFGDSPESQFMGWEEEWGPRHFGSHIDGTEKTAAKSWMNPGKFFTSETQHERRKRNWLEWLWKRSAADPEFIQQWIQEHGPYMYHATTRDGLKKITDEGIFPHDHLGTGESQWYCPSDFCDHKQSDPPKPGNRTGDMCPKCGDTYLKEMPGHSNSEYAGGYWEPRQGHVYLADKGYVDNYSMRRDASLVRVDLRKLDPKLMSADEDHWHPNNPKLDMSHPVVKSLYETDPPPDIYNHATDGMGLGEWADHVNLGHEPEETHYSMGMGSLAYNSHIPADAIEHVSPYGYQPYQHDAEGKPFVPISKTAHGTRAMGPGSCGYCGKPVVYNDVAKLWRCPDHGAYVNDLPQNLYHVSPRENREGILQHGLLTNPPGRNYEVSKANIYAHGTLEDAVKKGPNGIGNVHYDPEYEDIWEFAPHGEWGPDHQSGQTSWAIRNDIRSPRLVEPHEWQPHHEPLMEQKRLREEERKRRLERSYGPQPKSNNPNAWWPDGGQLMGPDNQAYWHFHDAKTATRFRPPEGGLYHAAPTRDRARILQHGLQVSNPHANPRWEYALAEMDQPPGVYAVDHPDKLNVWKMWGGDDHRYPSEEGAWDDWEEEEDPTQEGRTDAWDTWHIPAEQIKQLHRDPGSNAWVIPHTVQPVLHKGPEDEQRWPQEPNREWTDWADRNYERPRPYMDIGKPVGFKRLPLANWHGDWKDSNDWLAPNGDPAMRLWQGLEDRQGKAGPDNAGSDVRVLPESLRSLAAIHPELDWVTKNTPWQPLGQNKEGHWQYGWHDESGNQHLVTGWLGHGGSKKIEPGIAIRNTRAQLNRCQKGMCNHVFTGTEAPAQNEVSLDNLQRGQQIALNEDRWKVVDHLPEENIVAMMSLTTGEEGYFNTINGQRVAKTSAYYHMAPTSDRARILTHGLVAANPLVRAPFLKDVGGVAPTGVFMGRTPHDVMNLQGLAKQWDDPYDVWEVHPPGQVLVDPDLRTHVYTPDDVHPQHLKLHTPWEDNQEDNRESIPNRDFQWWSDRGDAMMDAYWEINDARNNKDLMIGRPTPKVRKASEDWGFPHKGLFHTAPTSERARILQHGLQPSNPHQNPRWQWQLDGLDQPTGIYAEENPLAMDAWEGNSDTPPEAHNHHWDVWHIPEEQIKDMHPDPVSSGWVIPHPVQPTLYSGAETQEIWPHEWRGYPEAYERPASDMGIGKPTQKPIRMPLASWGDSEEPVNYNDPEWYYHLAPTEDRARIQQHGLQPSSPAWSGHWGPVQPGGHPPTEMMRNQPKGIYVTTWPGDFGSDRYGLNGKKMDLWRIHKDHIESMRDDPVISDAYVIQHPVHAELHKPFEHHDSDAEWAWEHNQGIARDYAYDTTHIMNDKERNDWMIGRPTPKVRKVTKETPAQRQKSWEKLLTDYPDRTKLLYTTPEGYTIRHLSTFGDVSRTGLMMRNCWRGLASYSDQSRPVSPIAKHQKHSLNDENGHPQIGFFVVPRGDTRVVQEALGHRNKRPQPEHLQALKDWAHRNMYDFEEANYENPMLTGEDAVIQGTVGEGVPVGRQGKVWEYAVAS
jgi:hypothetical protein